MADPLHSNRAQKEAYVRSAYEHATSLLHRPTPVETRRYLHPVHKYPMSQYEYEDLMEDMKRDRDKTLIEEREKDDKLESREDSQYTIALKTAFELGMKAGLMQRPHPPPCSACERRKERNRIAAQTSRIEKRRLEQLNGGALLPPPTRRKRLPTAGVPPAPAFTFERAPLDTLARAETTPDADVDEDTESEGEYDDAPPPPF